MDKKTIIPRSKLLDSLQAILTMFPVVFNVSIFLAVSAWVLVHTIIQRPQTAIGWAFPIILCAVPVIAAPTFILFFILLGKMSPPTPPKDNGKNGIPVYQNGKKVDEI